MTATPKPPQPPKVAQEQTPLVLIEGGASEPKAEHRSAATVLVEMAISQYMFGISTDGEAFVVPRHGPPVARLLRAGKLGLRTQLARSYFDTYAKAVGQQALADALLVIEGMCGDCTPEDLPQRVAQCADGWWIDLGDASGDAIHISGSGWKTAAPPMRFRRTVLTAALPTPVRGGNLDELWLLVNVAEADRPLTLAWQVAAMIARIPHPVLALFGEQGTGKSTAAKMLTSLLDPSPVPLRKSPRDSEAWVTAAAGSWIVALDNISTIPEWLSDALCRAVTGEGDVRRQLYTDGGLALFAFRRAVVLTGIDPGAVRGDLEERLLVIELSVIGEELRCLDEDLESLWRAAYPRILGALLDLAVRVAQALPGVSVRRWPRMADFARVLQAVDNVLGTEGFDRYADRGRSLAAESLTAEPFIVEMRRQLGAEFTGTSAELLAAIVHGEPRPPKGWPASARGLTTMLKRQAPVMRRVGWLVEDDYDAHEKKVMWTVASPENTRTGAPQAPHGPLGGQPSGVLITNAAGDAGQAHSDDAALPRGEGPACPSVAGIADDAGPDPAASLAADSDPGIASMEIGDETAFLSPEEATSRWSSVIGSCAVCRDPIERYGARGRSLCTPCAAALDGVDDVAAGASGEANPADEVATT